MATVSIVLLAVVAGIGEIGYRHSMDHYRVAIAQVNRDRAHAADMAWNKGQGKNKPDRKGYVEDDTWCARCFADSLVEIDTSKCPTAFQRAWLEFVQDSERANGVATALGIVRPSLAGVAKAVEQKQETELAWQRCQFVAQSYGVKIP